MNILEALERNRLKELANPATERVIKSCSWCKQIKPVEDFHKNRRNKKGGYSYKSYCKQCHAEKYQNYTSPSAIKRKRECEEKRQKRIHQALSRTEKACSICGITKHLSDFNLRKDSLDGREGRCKDCANKKAEQYRRQKGMRPNEDILAEKRAGRKYRNQLAAQLGLDTEKFYLSEPGKCGHTYQGTGLTLRYCGNWHCVECSTSYGKDYLKKYVVKEKLRYQNWLKNPRLSPTVLDLVEKEARRYFWENRYWLDEEYRKRCSEKYKERYQKNIQKERNRVRAYKMANPEKRDEWNKKRWDRIIRQSDGSVSVRFVNDLINKSQKCPYCLVKMADHEKTLDHIIPIAKGGLHSAINIIVCCRTCNFQKSDLSFPEWLGTLSSKGQASARKMYRQKYGTEPEQCFLPFTFK